MVAPTDISLDSTVPDTTPQEAPVSLDATSSGNYLLDPKSIQDRAFKASYGLQNTVAAKPQSDIQDALTQGAEDGVRAEAATKLDSRTMENRFNLLTDTAVKKNGPLTPDDLKNVDIASGYNFPFKYPTDPSSVFEQNYATQYTSELDRFSTQLPDDNPWNVGRNVATNDVEARRLYGSIVMAQHQYLLTKLQDVQSQINSQSTTGAVVDYAKLLTTALYPEIKSRGNVPGVGFFAGGLGGTNLELQSNALASLPYDQFTKTVDAIVESKAKDNPHEAAAWISNMMGQSTGDKVLNNLNTLGALTELGAVVSIGKSVTTKALLNRQLNQAVKDTVVANANPDATKASILASIGDTAGSAVADEAQSLKSKLSGSTAITDNGIDSLQRFYRPDVANLANDSTINITRRNILQQQMASSQDGLLNALGNMLRPGTVPIEGATEDFLSAVAKNTFNRYAGLSNDIIRLSDPYWEPITRRLLVTGQIGTNAGELLPTLDTAYGRAQFHGLKVTYDPDQLAELDARIKALKDEYSAGPSMHDDTAGLNYYNDIPNRIKQLTDQRDAVSKPGGYPIKGQGLGYYIEVTKPVDQTSKLLTDFLVNPDRIQSVSPNSWTRFIPYLNKVRTAEDTVSAEHRVVRKSAVYPQSVMMAYAHQVGQYVNDLASGKILFDPVTGDRVPWYKQGLPGIRRFQNKERWNNFYDTLKYNQTQIGPDGREGHFFTQQELNDHYLRNYNRPPSIEENLAYQANKDWWEMDRILREVGEVRNRLQMGAETHQVSYKDATGNIVKSDEFDGMVQTKFPTNGKGNILILGDTPEDTKVLNLSRMSTSKAEKFNEDLLDKSGYKVVKLYRSEDKPFNGFVDKGNTQIDYVATKNLETRPLKWEQVPRTGGGHMVYDYEWYIKQAIIDGERIEGQSKYRYQGDQTLFPVKFRAMGQQFADRLNMVRKMIGAGREEEAKAIWRDASMPMDYDEFAGYFKSQRDPKGRFIPARFNIDEDFHVIPKNKSIIEFHGAELEKKYTSGLTKRIPRGLFIDGTREGSPSKAWQVEFTGQRDARGLFALDNTGTSERPVWNLRPADKVDPIEIMNRSLGKIVRSTVVDDYKNYAVQAFLQEVKDKINFTPSEIKSSPMYIFRTMNENYFKPSVQVQDRAKYMANHFKINQLLGVPSTWDTFMHSIAQNLADASYEKFGKSLVPQWLLHTTKDPFSFLRSLTFNAYLGLFSIPQIFVQMMTYVNIHAISPTHAPAGSMAALLHGFSRLNKNPEILSALDKLASQIHIPGMVRWNPGEFTEAMRALEKTGFSNVAGEFGPLDTLNHTKVIGGPLTKFLEWGQAPFKAGERSVRIGAWYTAYKEFRTKTPTGALTNADLQKILDRADFLYGNMSTASNSLLHTGVLSLPTQFYAYNLRLAELFFSKRIAGGLGETVSERAAARARIIAVNAAMFGVPMSLGVSGIPVGDYLRQEALDHGYLPGQAGNLVTGLMEGIPSLMLAHATGNYYNIPQRYATGGFTQIRNILNSDASFWEIVGGASANLAMNTWSGTDGLVQYMSQFMRRDQTRDIPLKLEDFVDIFKEWTIVNKSYGLWTALNTGKWISKSGNLVMEGVSPLNALFMTGTGLNPLLQSDAHNYQVNFQSLQNTQKFAMKEAQLNLTRAYTASANGDPNQAQDFFTKAMARLEAADMTSRQIATIIARSIKGNESIVDRVVWEQLQKAPKNKQQQYSDIYSYVHKTLKGQQ